MNKRARIARTAVISNGMFWFGLSLFLGAFAMQLAPAAMAGEWAGVIGWILLVLATIGLIVMGLVEQSTMRAARIKHGHLP